MGRPTRYTPDDVERWLRAYDEGMTLEEIAWHEPATPETIGRRLRTHPDYHARPAQSRPGPRGPHLTTPPPPDPHSGVHRGIYLGARGSLTRRRQAGL